MKMSLKREKKREVFYIMNQQNKNKKMFFHVSSFYHAKYENSKPGAGVAAFH